MRRNTVLAISLILLTNFIAAAPAAAENRVALVVGNSNYRHVPSLANPADDARLMAATLGGLGFRLVGGAAQIDLDKLNLDAVIRNFGNQLQGADVGLFYYAGHGVQMRGANYLVPVGANPTREADVDFELEDVKLILRQMEDAGTRLNIVMLDACRNNPFGVRGLRGADSGLAQMRAPEGTLISFSTQPGNAAQDGEAGNSPYTRALAETIRQPELGVFEVFNEVGLKVKKETGGVQQPWLSSSPIEGNFYFAGLTRPNKASAATATPVELQDKALTHAPAPVSQRPDPSIAPSVPPVPAADVTSEVARTWSIIKDTTSRNELEDFIRQFGPTPYGSLARGRLDELKNAEKITVVSPPVEPAVPSETPQKDSGKRGVAIYNGTWTLTSSSSCLPMKPSRLMIKNGVVSAPNWSGTVSADGSVHTKTVTMPGGRASGRMSSTSSGSGTWSFHSCSGAWWISR
jgi:hypothetical protein